MRTQIPKCHVCTHRTRCHFQKQDFCADRAQAVVSGGAKLQFRIFTKEAFVLRTEAACAALAAWDARSEVAWAAWRA